MARPDRLFRLLSALRTLPHPVTAAQLAAATGVSERSLYRDIASLRDGGAMIIGAAGVGYSLTERQAPPVPPFAPAEVEAIMTGLADLARHGDPALAQAARDATTKLSATLPEAALWRALLVTEAPAAPTVTPPALCLDVLRQAVQEATEVRIMLLGANGSLTSRAVWPLAVAHIDRQPRLTAWGVQAQQFQTIDVASIRRAAATGVSFRHKRHTLLRQFLTRER